MNHVTLFVSSPTSGEEAIPTANNLCVEISRELRPIIGEPPNTEIAAKERRREIDVLRFQLMKMFNGNWDGSTYHYGDCDIVAVATALLSALETCARIETVVALRTHTDTRNVDVRIWSRRML
jgi:hypothetical protein